MIFHAPKGIIALDIDGTITAEAHTIHPEVVQYFTSLEAAGWRFMFLTGRPFQWGYKILQHCPFPYFFCVQNGATTIDMPSREVINKKYLIRDLLPQMESICKQEKTDFIIYSGFENDDLCYYRNDRFSPDLLAYIELRAKTLKENWKLIDSFDELHLDGFASLKYFAKEEPAKRLEKAIETQLGLHAPRNRDPFNRDYFVVQATHPEANKGKALRSLVQSGANHGPLIAAGDDYNDLSMLQEATIKIVMANAPQSLLDLADIVAPPATENGIIVGLAKAIQMVEKS